MGAQSKLVKRALKENNLVLLFIDNFRSKNNYNPRFLKEYNKKFNSEFNYFLNNSGFLKDTISIFE